MLTMNSDERGSPVCVNMALAVAIQGTKSTRRKRRMSRAHHGEEIGMRMTRVGAQRAMAAWLGLAMLRAQEVALGLRDEGGRSGEAQPYPRS